MVPQVSCVRQWQFPILGLFFPSTKAEVLQSNAVPCCAEWVHFDHSNPLINQSTSFTKDSLCVILPLNSEGSTGANTFPIAFHTQQVKYSALFNTQVTNFSKDISQM